MRAIKAFSLGATAVAMLAATPLQAAQCGNTSAGFGNWVQSFKQEAAGRGVSPAVLDRAFSNVNYNQATIRADRGQHSFKLSFDQFMQKRGGQAIISRGKAMKKNNAALFANIERAYGVPAGPLLAIWGMETGFGGFMGNQHTLSAVATLSYDCRRSDYFTEQLYAALKLVGNGSLNINAKGAAHGEIGQTQFLPLNVVRYGVDFRSRWSHRSRRLARRCAGFDRKLPCRTWLAARRWLSAGSAKLCRDPGLERSDCLSAGDCLHRQGDRRAIVAVKAVCRTADVT